MNRFLKQALRKKQRKNAFTLSVILHIIGIALIFYFVKPPPEQIVNTVYLDILSPPQRQMVQKKAIEKVRKPTKPAISAMSVNKLPVEKLPASRGALPIVTNTPRLELPPVSTDTRLAPTPQSLLADSKLNTPKVELGSGTGSEGIGLSKRGAGGNVPGPGRGGTGSGIGRGLSSVTGVADIGSVIPDDSIGGLGIFDDDVKPGHGLIGKVYVPGKTFRYMPNFKQMKSLYTFTAANLDVARRNYTEGFPTPQKQNVFEYFAIHFRGKLAVATPGVYMFELSSDDGSKLFINGKLVVDNDGLHPTQSSNAHITLRAGFHPIEIHYFQGPAHELSLQWYYKPPNQPRQIVPPEVIFHLSNPDDPDELKKIKQHIKKMEK